MAATTALVTHVVGQAWMRSSDGALVPLAPGMRVPVNAEIVTADGGRVELQADGVPPLVIGENRDFLFTADVAQGDVDPGEAAIAPPADAQAERLLAAIQAGADPFELLDPTAAVQSGGGSGGGGFTRLLSAFQLSDGAAGDLSYSRPAVFDGNDTGLRMSDSSFADPTLVTGTTKLTVIATPNVTEGGVITYTVVVGNPVTSTPLIVTLSNGVVITIPVGASVGSASVEARADDAYRQGDVSVNVGVSSAVGGNFAALDTSGTATTVVSDDADATAITLTADAASVVEGGAIVYTATVGTAVTGSPLVVTLNNGATITIPVGQTSGASAPVAVRADDAHAQGDQPVTVSIDGTSGGNFEALDTTSTVTTTVTDDGDVTSIALTADAASVVEGGAIVYTAAVGAPVAGTPLVVTLSNGATITIPVGQSSGVSEPVAVRADDAHAQGAQDVTVSIKGTSGGNFEALDTSSIVITTVIDDADLVTLRLEGPDSVNEGAVTGDYTVSLSEQTATPLTATFKYSGTAANGSDFTG
ncbi:MAG TPA: retention module-containing protein, partial [Candidimonas sp.]|nr:retention module-containing protein [Candidimonas sp.]